MMTLCDCCGRSYYAAAGERTCAYCLVDRLSAHAAGFVHDASSHGTPAECPHVGYGPSCPCNTPTWVPAWRRRAADPDTARAADLTGQVRA